MSPKTLHGFVIIATILFIITKRRKIYLIFFKAKMKKVKCYTCGKEFAVKPYFLNKGWGKYCSRVCHHAGMRSGETVACATCGGLIYRSTDKLKRPKSGKFFCDKSCQTVWRNRFFSGKKHKNWKDGTKITYRNILIYSKKENKCVLCNEIDTRVLAAHHINENHQDHRLENLAWLCHNCHHLVHTDRNVKAKFLEVVKC